MKILIIEPYYTGSHAAWAEGIKINSRHDIHIINMPGRYWKWRMHGGSITLAKVFLGLDFVPDLILATDMLDLSGFLSLTRKKTGSIPVAVYFHENQLNYPWSPSDRDIVNKRDMHYVFINLISALSADYVFFNSQFHLKSFINGLPKYLKNFPDYNELSTVEIIEKKSSVLPLGIGLNKFDKYNINSPKNNSVPVILWNHRWEYDKNPGDFFNVLYKLQNDGLDFQIVVVGENFRKSPEEFHIAKKKLGSKILKFGYADTFMEYAELLWKSDIQPVTSNQDFFGISIMEALYCGSIPLLPKRLTYPELIPINEFNEFFYNDVDDLEKKLGEMIQNFNSSLNKQENRFKKLASIFDWKNMINKYDDLFETIHLTQP